MFFCFSYPIIIFGFLYPCCGLRRLESDPKVLSRPNNFLQQVLCTSKTVHVPVPPIPSPASGVPESTSTAESTSAPPPPSTTSTSSISFPPIISVITFPLQTPSPTVAPSITVTKPPLPHLEETTTICSEVHLTGFNLLPPTTACVYHVVRAS